jgi:hypothetical protein
MAKNIKLIYLEQYNEDFRSGYDAANVTFIMRELLKLFYEKKITERRYLTIHKNSIGMCQGLCAENSFYSELKSPKGTDDKLKALDEVWLMIMPSKMMG